MYLLYNLTCIWWCRVTWDLMDSNMIAHYSLLSNLIKLFFNSPFRKCIERSDSFITNQWLYLYTKILTGLRFLYTLYYRNFWCFYIYLLLFLLNFTYIYIMLQTMWLWCICSYNVIYEIKMYCNLKYINVCNEKINTDHWKIHGSPWS